MVNAIVFIIDSVDRARFNESKGELDALLTDEQIAQLPILILGNKIDCAGEETNNNNQQASVFFRNIPVSRPC